MIKPTGIVDAIKGTEYLVKCKIDACFEPINIKRKYITTPEIMETRLKNKVSFLSSKNLAVDLFKKKIVKKANKRPAIDIEV
tara:strand:+ start:60 stop:305 length:246 start_codon:yes stop_codon:yes gene_type:complete